MDFCKRASELKSLSDLPFFTRLKDVVNFVDLDDIVLGIRSGNLFYNIPREALSTGTKIDEDDWWIYLDMIGEVKDYLRAEGFIRNDMDEIMMPERYVSEMYLIPCGLVDKQVCQPYFYSNREYETYSFEYSRLRLIMNILEDELSDKQIEVVKRDVMNAEKYCYNADEAILAEVRRFMRDNRRRLEQRFKVCWL